MTTENTITETRGSIWWTGQLANKLGRLDPKTARRRSIRSRLPAPVGLAEDQNGNIALANSLVNQIGLVEIK